MLSSTYGSCALDRGRSLLRQETLFELFQSGLIVASASLHDVTWLMITPLYHSCCLSHSGSLLTLQSGGRFSDSTCRSTLNLHFLVAKSVCLRSLKALSRVLQGISLTCPMEKVESLSIGGCSVSFHCSVELCNSNTLCCAPFAVHTSPAQMNNLS